MTKRIKLIPKNCPEAIVLGEEYKELYEEAFAKTAEKYGKDSLAYRTITNGINKEKITGSQFFWNTNLGFSLPKNQKVIQLEDFGKILEADESFFNGFYTDTNQLVLRSNKPTWEENEYISKDLVKQLGKNYEFSSENPLVLTNLELVKDNNSKNKYGLLLKINENTKVENDKRLAYGNKKIQLGNFEKRLYTKKDSLSRFFLFGGEFLCSEVDFLDGSFDDGRVVIIEDKR